MIVGELVFVVEDKHTLKDGFIIDVLQNLEKELNFKASYIKGPFRNIRFKQVQMILWIFCLPIGQNEAIYGRAQIHLSRPLLIAKDLILVPPGQAFSSYEKLSFPFDKETWFLIAFTFLVSYFVIFIINFASIKIRNLVFGERVASPSLNVAAHFFGLGQLVLPRRNFARFLVMSFIIYSLIIRSAWQGKMFEFLNKEQRKPQVESVEEAKEKYFEFYLWQCSEQPKCNIFESFYCFGSCGEEFNKRVNG
jgi:hypothetical protein